MFQRSHFQEVGEQPPLDLDSVEATRLWADWALRAVEALQRDLGHSQASANSLSGRVAQMEEQKRAHEETVRAYERVLAARRELTVFPVGSTVHCGAGYNIPATVLLVTWGQAGLRYTVGWWDGSTRKTAELLEGEVLEIPPLPHPVPPGSGGPTL